MKVVAGLGGIATPPVALLAYSSKRWSEYVQYMLEQYEATKEQLRQNLVVPKLEKLCSKLVERTTLV
jgi:hypothetical protein